MTDHELAEQIIVERGALEAWRASLGREPTEPLHTKGGALDPQAWCMKAAKAIHAGKRAPRLNKDRECPQWLADQIAEAMGHESGSDANVTREATNAQ